MLRSPFNAGTDCQVLTVSLKPGATVESEAGAMMFMSPEVRALHTMDPFCVCILCVHR